MFGSTERYLCCGSNPKRGCTPDTLSQISSLASNERSLVLHLVLTTLAGEELQMVIDLQEFDRLDEFETAVLENLPFIGGHSTFGCELVFVNKDTRAILADPIWDTLRDSNLRTVPKPFESRLLVRVVCYPMPSHTRSI